jgi:hypothetical protein
VRRLTSATLLATSALFIVATSASAVPPQILKTSVSSVTSTAAVLEAEVNPQGNETEFHFEYGLEDCEVGPCTITPVPDGTTEAVTSPVVVKAEAKDLSPATVYHYRVVIHNGEGEVKGPDHIFATYAGAPEGLPDERAYEQSSPTNKDGGDAEGDIGLTRATADGKGVTFGSTFGIPGGKGAQVLPFYLARRGEGESGWATQGLLPPASFGQRARILAWTPNYTEVFTEATQLGSPEMTTMLVQPASGGEPITIAPYTANAEYFYAGQSAEGAEVFFESRAKLTPNARKGALNLYVWQRSSGQITLASVLNGESAPPKGGFAGPYDWGNGISGRTLSEGGAARNYYLQEEHAITEAGDVYFTEAGTGQLYLRLNPTQPQSPMEGEKCLDAAKACTIHVSASQKSDGTSESGTDPAGPQPAAFQAATADGEEVFFTSPEKLTNDANTGPEQPEASIGRGNVTTGAVEEAKFIPEHALGVAVDAKYIYWANPSLGTIGREELGNPASIEPAFISPGPVEFEIEAGVFEEVESSPRYVAVDAGHVYWTNTGRTNPESGQPLDGGGTIGRADIEGTPGSIEADFIRGASNPQGIAVDAGHVYWANAANNSNKAAIGRAEIDGGEVEQTFFRTEFGKTPQGVAVDGSHVYFNANDENSDSYLERISLEGGEEEFTFIGKVALRGIALDVGNVYWAAQGEEAIGRLPLADFPKFGPCAAIASCKKEFAKVGGNLVGLAVDAAHLYWSVNGEASVNPGNDLYRFVPATKELEDLTALGTVGSGDGAEVQGLVGAAADGSRLYLVANGSLDGSSPAGNCHSSSAHGRLSTTSGSCELYRLEGKAASAVARLQPGAGERTDALDWAATPRELFGSASYVQRSAFTSKDAKTLVFRSRAKLSPYDNEGAPELYRYRLGDAAIRCLSCRPSGERAEGGPSLGSVGFPFVGPAVAAVASVTARTMAAGGDRAFFETTEALSPEDTNAQGGCPQSGGQDAPACLDVYEWEAPGTGGCEEGGEGYSPLNEGCVYLISTGKSKFPSFFADASESGEDVFFHTRDQLVGQDQDELQDVYDARVGGGLASQNPRPVVPCEGVEACHEAVPPSPVESTPATPNFTGPGNPAPKHNKKKHKHHKHHAKKHKAKNKGRAGR